MNKNDPFFWRFFITFKFSMNGKFSFQKASEIIWEVDHRLGKETIWETKMEEII